MYRPLPRYKRKPTATAVPPDPTIDPVEVAKIELAKRRAMTQEKELLFDLAGEKSLREDLGRLVREATARLAPPPAHAPLPPHPGASEETALLMLSDWHAYEIVKKERVQGFNEYCAAIFARRAKRIVDSTLAIRRRMQAGGGWRVRKCVVAANGDFVSGTIHDVERHTDAPHILAAVIGCARTLSLAVRDLAAEFEVVEVFCTSGNHGRLSDHKKMSAKDPTRNWDWLIYMMAEQQLADITNVKFYIPDSYVLSFMIGSKRFVQYHGHSIKSWNSIPHYGIARWTRGVQALKSQQLTPVDYFLISHFHSDSSMPTSGGQIKLNGSLIGGTEYSVESLGVSDIPIQKLMFVSDPVGVNSEWPICGEIPGERRQASYPVYPWERPE